MALAEVRSGWDDRSGGSVRTMDPWLPGLSFAATASIGAGAINAAAAGMHVDTPTLARVFVVCAAAQILGGVVALARPRRAIAWAIVAINVVVVGGWLVTRVRGIGAITGLEHASPPHFADTSCALLGATAAGAAAAAALIGWQRSVRPARSALSGMAIAALVLPAMWVAATRAPTPAASASGANAVAGAPVDTSQPHVHDHSPAPAASPSTSTGATTTTADESQPHTHDHGAATATATTTAGWPRPWDPTAPVDVGGVAGVTVEQQQRAEALISGTLLDLPRFATTQAAIDAGYTSIGDAPTGTEHYIKTTLVQDDVMLDPSQPESLVYRVDGDKRTLEGAMYIASARPIDDPSLTGYAGPLIQWHVHDNLCWSRDAAGKATVVGLTDAAGNCSRGVKAGGENPMVHVWIVARPCGVFSALEGIGAGSAAVPNDQRVDTCPTTHDHTAAAVPPVPYDPSKPIDLSGIAGVTPQQQAAAENLVAINVVRLPQWSDYHTAEAAGFQSIGDGATGFEHYVQWGWINDTVALDPDHPESLVYKPMPDGTKQLVSAMYMLPDTLKLTDVPDIGGALMQWHIHDNLCFTTDLVAPKVAGITSAAGTCPAGLVKFRAAPMIHVWITPNSCGPFAALEGVGAGQIADGQTRLCDHAHGDGLL